MGCLCVGVYPLASTCDGQAVDQIIITSVRLHLFWRSKIYERQEVVKYHWAQVSRDRHHTSFGVIHHHLASRDLCIQI